MRLIKYKTVLCDGICVVARTLMAMAICYQNLEHTINLFRLNLVVVVLVLIVIDL